MLKEPFLGGYTRPLFLHRRGEQVGQLGEFLRLVNLGSPLAHKLPSLGDQADHQSGNCDRVRPERRQVDTTG